MEKVKALSWLAGGNPHGCNVGIYMKEDEAVVRAAALFVAMHPKEAASGRFCRWA